MNLACDLMLLWLGLSIIQLCICTERTGGFDGLPSGFVVPPYCAYMAAASSSADVAESTSDFDGASMASQRVEKTAYLHDL